MGESKSAVLDLVPESVKPKTILVKLPTTTVQVLQIIETAGLLLPVILSPT